MDDAAPIAPVSIADPNPPCAGPLETAADVRRRLAALGDTDWPLLCVLDERRVLLGVLSPQRLIGLPDACPVGSAARTDLPTARGAARPEAIASLAIEHALPAVAVVDDDGRLLGVAGAPALMDTLRREHVQDLHRLAGVAAERGHAREALEEPPLRRARHRLPWLVIGLAGSALATGVVAGFEHVLTAQPAVAFFVPGLVYLADAIGTQSEAIAVRGLSLSRIGWPRLVAGELRTGLLMGLVLAVLAFGPVALIFGDLRLAGAIALSLAGASAVATVLGLSLPLVLSRLGVDPAYGSGPLATIVQDVLSLLIYFACVTWIVL
jgi:magnesium transporter